MYLLAQAEGLFGGLGAGALGSLVFGILGILILVIGYKFFDKITPSVDIPAKLNEGNVAVAIVVAAFIVGVALIAANAIN
jgi:uncharacterized membrane protein YjfL (UPF0719 family)